MIITETIYGDIELNDVKREYSPNVEYEHICDCGESISTDIIDSYISSNGEHDIILLSCQCGAEYEIPIKIIKTVVEFELQPTEVIKL
jgi:hypothetical protein